MVVYFVNYTGTGKTKIPSRILIIQILNAGKFFWLKPFVFCFLFYEPSDFLNSMIKGVRSHENSKQ